MNEELQQRIIQKQATQIGNLMYSQSLGEAQIDQLNEKVARLEDENAALRAGQPDAKEAPSEVKG